MKLFTSILLFAISSTCFSQEGGSSGNSAYEEAFNSALGDVTDKAWVDCAKRAVAQDKKAYPNERIPYGAAGRGVIYSTVEACGYAALPKKLSKVHKRYISHLRKTCTSDPDYDNFSMGSKVHHPYGPSYDEMLRSECSVIFDKENDVCTM